MTQVFYICVIFVAVLSTVPGFRVPDRLNNDKVRSKRLINGVIADPKDWPFFVNIQWFLPEPHSVITGPTCGGSLIAEDLVLTAAHCLYLPENLDEVIESKGKIRMKNLYPAPSENIRVTINNYNLLTKEPGEKTIKAKQIIIHPKYEYGKDHQNDIALIQLKDSVKCSGNRPILLPIGNLDIDELMLENIDDIDELMLPLASFRQANCKVAGVGKGEKKFPEYEHATKHECYNWTREDGINWCPSDSSKCSEVSSMQECCDQAPDRIDFGQSHQQIAGLYYYKGEDSGSHICCVQNTTTEMNPRHCYPWESPHELFFSEAITAGQHTQPVQLEEIQLGGVMGYEECKETWPGMNAVTGWTAQILTPGMLCDVEHNKEQATCFGDSGGPLVCEYGDTKRLLGIASFVRRPCGLHDTPDVYADVTHFIPWIIGELRKDKSMMLSFVKSILECHNT